MILQNLCFKEKFLNVRQEIYFLLTGITIYIRNYIRTYKIYALINNLLFTQFFYLPRGKEKKGIATRSRKFINWLKTYKGSQVIKNVEFLEILQIDRKYSLK